MGICRKADKQRKRQTIRYISKRIIRGQKADKLIESKMRIRRKADKQRQFNQDLEKRERELARKPARKQKFRPASRKQN
jgi:hypothetical protein